MKNKILTILMAIAVIFAVGCASPNAPLLGQVEATAIDPPRQVRYPGAGITQDINQSPVYWAKLEGRWHRVTEDEFARAQVGEKWARLEVVHFTPPF